MTQEQLNTDIAQELNKWQPIIEYSRMKLDEDTEVRSNFKWLVYLYRCAPLGIIGTVVEGIISCCVNSDFLFPLLLILIAVVIVICMILLFKRKTIKKLINDSDKKEFYSLLDDGVRYLDELGRMLINTAPGRKQTNTSILSIESNYRNSKTLMAPKENRFSVLNGKIDKELQQKSHQVAEERLKRYQYYI